MKSGELKILKPIAWGLAFLGFATIITFMCISPFNDWSGQTDSVLFGLYGDFIGGFAGSLFSLAGFFLLYLTFRAQQHIIKQQDEELKAQKKAFEQESFETTFFNLLNVQQNLTNEIKAYFKKLKGVAEIEDYAISGREFFSIAVKERFQIEKSLSSQKYFGMHSCSNIYSYLDKEPTRTQKEREIQLVNEIYGITKEKWQEGRKKEGIDRINFIYDLFFHKYHYAIGHYFRNLYHIVRFIRQFEVIQRRKNRDQLEDERIIKQCKNYAQFIQAQMSSDELALLHDNSLGFPRMLKLVKKYNLVDNCSIEDLIDKTNFIKEC